jgi:hypothetical protein
MYSVRIISLSLLLVACGDKGGSDDTADGFAPQEGGWTITPGAMEDGCGSDAVEDDGDTETTTLTMNSDGSGFSFMPDAENPDDEADPLECTLDGMDFSCAIDDEDEEDEIDGMDATILQTTALNGSFTNTTTGEVTLTFTFDCEGGDCGDVADAFGLTGFPCSNAQTYGLSAD